jgi:hypothetical protein
VTTNPVRYDGSIDLHYSPDDGGWYAQDYAWHRVSLGTYETRRELIADLDAGRHEWQGPARIGGGGGGGREEPRAA